MIPRKIHYCWFGGNPLPSLAVKCIDSWRKFLPDYEIIEWNESNFDIECCSYVKEAYGKKKWAFVSDYARFKILYEHGGLYFDTDVEVIKSMDDIITNGPFMGCEPINTQADNFYTNFGLAVNAGLGLAANAGHDLYKAILENYHKSHFINTDGSINQLTVVMRVTEILKNLGFRQDLHEIQKIGEITIYPSDYFCPKDIDTGILKITNNTRSIHHFDASWWPEKDRKWQKIRHCAINKYGETLGSFLIDNPISKNIGKIYKRGFRGSINRIIDKINRLKLP